MILSDGDLTRPRYQDLVTPFKQANVQPASIDLTLDTSFVKYDTYDVVDLGDVPGTVGPILKWTADSYQLEPKSFVLGSTAEWVHVPDNMVGVLNGRSSLARLGLLVHATGAWLDPGFSGTVTLEFYNCSHRPIILRAGLKICQVSFTTLLNTALKPYGHPDLGSKYQGQSEATESKYVG